MIHYLIQTTSAHPDLLKAVPPPGLLSPGEATRCAELRFERRRRDWLLGRWTAKHLMQGYLARETGESWALVDLLIVNAADGAPEVEMHNAQCTMRNGSAQPALVLLGYASHSLQAIRLETVPVCSTDAELGNSPLATRTSQLAIRHSLSISHSRDTSLCAVMDGSGGTVGADLEWIEAREPGFVAQFFTPEEMALVAGCDPEGRDALVTAIWCGKEAVLKALRMGLRADTRSVSVTPRLEVAQKQPDHPSSPPGWLPMDVKVSQELVDSTVSSFSKFEGWWQVYEGFVLALAVKRT